MGARTHHPKASWVLALNQMWWLGASTQGDLGVLGRTVAMLGPTYRAVAALGHRAPPPEIQISLFFQHKYQKDKKDKPSGKVAILC